MPVDPSQCMAAAGFDHGVAVHSGMEAGAHPNMQRSLYGQALRRFLDQPRIDDRQEGDPGEQFELRIDNHRDFILIQDG